MQMPLIYIVEDDLGIRDVETTVLQRSGFRTEEFRDALSALARIDIQVPDLLLLDITLPGMTGLEMLQQLRRSPRYQNLPILLVTARVTEQDMVIGLDRGADDYITKPFSNMVLLSRTKALLRRTMNTENPEILEYRGIRLNIRGMTCEIEGVPITLTTKEFETLKVLMQNVGTVMNRDHLLNTIWGTDYSGNTRVLDVNINTLRKKLGNAGERIQTIWGIGYKLE